MFNPNSTCYGRGCSGSMAHESPFIFPKMALLTQANQGRWMEFETKFEQQRELFHATPWIRGPTPRVSCVISKCRRRSSVSACG